VRRPQADAIVAIVQRRHSGEEVPMVKDTV
jgi:hypothetical protein